MDERARLTIPDVVFVLVSLAVLYALLPVVYTLLDASAGDLGTGVVYLFKLVAPVAALVLLAGIYRTGIRGVGQ
jgi:hypothetical protein